MDFNEVKRIFKNCPDLKGLEETATSLLFWHSCETTLARNAIIYAEGTPLDDTLCVLLSGSLAVEKAGLVLGQITENQIFGEMAYFTRLHERTATVRVSSPHAGVLQIGLNSRELSTPPFSALKKYLGLQAWDRFVSGSQEV